MKGLQDMLDKLTNWVGEAETWINEKEQEPVGEELDVIEQQLAEHEVSNHPSTHPFIHSSIHHISLPLRPSKTR